MVIFLVTLAVSAASARFRSIIARLWRVMVVRRLVVATKVAIIMLVRVMVGLSVVVVVVAIANAWLAIFGVLTALLVGVLGLIARKLQRSFSLGLVAFLVTVVRRFVTAITIAIVAIIATA